MFITKNINIFFIIFCSLFVVTAAYGMGEKNLITANNYADWQDVQKKGAVKIEELKNDLNRCANDSKSLPVVYQRNKNEYVATIASLIDEIRVLLNSNEIEFRGIRNSNSYVYQTPAITNQDTKKNITNINSRIRKIGMKIKQVDFARKRLEKLGYCSFENKEDISAGTKALATTENMPEIQMAEEQCESESMPQHPTTENDHCAGNNTDSDITTVVAEIDTAMQPASATCATSDTPVSTESRPAIIEIKNETCPILDNPTNSNSPTIDLIDGRDGKTYRVRLCCPGCADKLKEVWEDNNNTFRDKLIKHRTVVTEKKDDTHIPMRAKGVASDGEPIAMPVVTDSTEDSAIRQTRDDLNSDSQYLTLIRLTYTSQMDDANKKALAILIRRSDGNKPNYINTNQEIRIWDHLARGYAKKVGKNPGGPNNASLEAAEKELRLIAVASGKPVYGQHYANKAVLMDKFRLSEDQIRSLSQKYKNPQERIDYLRSLATGEKSAPHKVPVESIGEKLENVSRQIETENIPHRSQHEPTTHDHSTHAAAHDNSAHATTGDERTLVSDQELTARQEKIDQARRAPSHQRKKREEDFMSILSNMRNNASTYSVDDFIKNADRALARAASSQNSATELTLFDNNIPGIVEDMLPAIDRSHNQAALEKLLIVLQRYQTRSSNKSYYNSVISSVEREIKENKIDSTSEHRHTPMAQKTVIEVRNTRCYGSMGLETDENSQIIDLEDGNKIYRLRVCCPGCIGGIKEEWKKDSGFRKKIIKTGS